MKIQAIICDIDGSLMNPSSGLYVDSDIQNKLIQLEEKGILIILNSARTIQGVEPLAKQLKMDEYGGYLISCNGCHVFNMKTKQTEFEYTIDQDTCLGIWKICQKYGLKPGFTQPDYAVCEEMTEGFYLDKETCQVDYMVTHSPEKHSMKSIWKSGISEKVELMDACYDKVRAEIETKYDVKVVRSTDKMADIVNSKSDKFTACTRLLNQLHIPWENVSVLGDGYADQGCIEAAGFGVTLENGKKEVKEIADLIVPSCYEKGAMVWLNLLEERL